MTSYDFRIGNTLYYLVDVTHNQLSTEAFQYIKSLSIDMKKMYVLSYEEEPTEKSTVAIIVGDEVIYQDLSKRSPYRIACVKEKISSSADYLAVEEAKEYLKEVLNK